MQDENPFDTERRVLQEMARAMQQISTALCDLSFLMDELAVRMDPVARAQALQETCAGLEKARKPR